MNEPLVSICCLVYNHEPYLRECFDGFVMQETNFPIEILVHDDASTDKSADIIREYTAMHSDLFKPIYQTENQYSKGIRISATYQFPRAKGKYTAICEGDDYWINPYKLQKQVDFLELNPEYSMCFHNAYKYYQDTGKKILFNNYKKDCDLSLHDAVHKWVVPTASIVGHSTLIKECYQKMSLIYSGDYSLILYFFFAGKIRFINEIMSVYRISYTGTSMSAIMKDENIFILEQHIILLDGYNKITNYKYKSEVSKRISFLKKEIFFQKEKEKSIFNFAINNPFFFIRKVIKKLNKILFYSYK